MPVDFFVTVEGLQQLQFDDCIALMELRHHQFLTADFSPLLEIIDLQHAIARRKAKLDRLEAISNDLPF